MVLILAYLEVDQNSFLCLVYNNRLPDRLLLRWPDPNEFEDQCFIEELHPGAGRALRKHVIVKETQGIFYVLAYVVWLLYQNTLNNRDDVRLDLLNDLFGVPPLSE